MKVLIVNDTPDNTYMLETLLKAHGWEVSAAVNGIEALEKLKQRTTDLIISDILMPKMDGFQLCRAVKTNAALKDMPFIFYTATYTTDKDKDFALSLGASRFIIKPTDPEEFIGIINEVMAQGDKGLIPPGAPHIENETEYLKEHQARMIKKLEDKLTQLREANLALEREIEKRNKAENALRKSEKQLRDVTSSLGEGVYVLNKRGQVTFVNPEAERLLGWTIHELNGVFHDFIHSQQADGTPLSLEDCKMHNVIKTGKAFSSTDEVFIRKDGTVFPVSVISSPILEDGKVVASVTAFQDITDLKNVRKRLEKSEKLYRMLFESAGDIIYVLDAEGEKAGRIISANKAAADLHGYTRDEMLNLSISDLDTPESAKAVPDRFQRILSGEWLKEEASHRKKDGTIFPIEISAGMFEVENHKYVLAIDRDITERKRAEELLRESEDRYRSLIETAKDAIYTVDTDGRFVSLNPAFDTITGFSRDEWIGKHFETFIHPDDLLLAAQMFQKALSAEETPVIEARFITKSGEYRMGEIDIVPLKRNNVVISVMGLGRDITERKQSEGKIQAALQEKELLLREIHHRVKNNLQIITSLLNIQSRNIMDSRSFEAFEESRHRVMAIANLHEKLYNSETLSRIDLNNYIGSVSSELLSSYGVTSGAITVTRKIQDIYFNIDTAIPCGLIINELLTNSIKYAFPDGKKGDVHIELYKNNGNAYTLTVSDNGIGLPAGFDVNNAKTVGLQLIVNLVKQLQGTMVVRGGMGTTFEISFAETKPQERI